MTNQYFVTASLPPLTLGDPPEISFFGFMTLLQENLSHWELTSVEVMRRLIDLYNLVAFWRGDELDPRGRLDHRELEEALSVDGRLPSYVLDFLERYQETAARLRAHGELVAQFFQSEISRARGFLRRYLEFERGWRLVMVAFRAHKLGRDLANELQWEDPTEILVAQLLAQRDAKGFTPPDGFEGLEWIFEDHYADPWELEMALERYRFDRVSDMIEVEMFTLDFILGYMAQLMITEKWQELHDRQRAINRT